MYSHIHEYYSMGQLSYEVHWQAPFILFRTDILITHMAYLRDIPTKAHRLYSASSGCTFFLQPLSRMGPYITEKNAPHFACRLLLQPQLCVCTLAGRIYL